LNTSAIQQRSIKVQFSPHGGKYARVPNDPPSS
jgi:hypothetical protein